MPVKHWTEDDSPCTICMDLKASRPQWELRSCGHSYCHVCLVEWIEKRRILAPLGPEAVCPICRREMEISEIMAQSSATSGASQRPPPPTQGSTGTSSASQRPPPPPPTQDPRGRSQFHDEMPPNLYPPPVSCGSRPQRFPPQRFPPQRFPPQRFPPEGFERFTTHHPTAQTSRYSGSSRHLRGPYNQDGSINTCLYDALESDHPDPIVRDMLRRYAELVLDSGIRIGHDIHRYVFEMMLEGPPGDYEVDLQNGSTLGFNVVERSDARTGGPPSQTSSARGYSPQRGHQTPRNGNRDSIRNSASSQPPAGFDPPSLSQASEGISDRIRNSASSQTPARFNPSPSQAREARYQAAAARSTSTQSSTTYHSTSSQSTTYRQGPQRTRFTPEDASELQAAMALSQQEAAEAEDAEFRQVLELSLNATQGRGEEDEQDEVEIMRRGMEGSSLEDGGRGSRGRGSRRR